MPPEPAISLVNALTLFGGVQGIIFAFILLGLAKDNTRANRYLGVILGILGIILLHQFTVETGYISRVPFLLGATSPFEIMLSPALYLYVRTMTVADEKNISRRWIVMPIIAMWFMLLPFFTTDFDTRMALIHNQYDGENLTLLLRVSFPLMMLASGIMFTVCIVLSFKLLFAHTRNIAHFFSYRENIELTWLRNLLLVMVGFWVMMIVYFLILPYFGMNSQEQIETQTSTMFLILDVFAVAAIFYLGVMGLLQPRVYHSVGLHTLEADVLEAQSADEDDFSTEVEGIEVEGVEVLESPHASANKYKKSALDQNQSERILKRLISVMEEQKPYLQSNLTLPDLARLASTTPNYLSQVINEQLNMSFFDYINSHRIETAKELLINPLPHTQTVLDVAMASAFNSKSAFYSAFKKQMGITPAKFKKSYP
ncbi:MAG: AraC-like DNA-binding protein [Flavobacteriales bacterium]|jgi:AraC-like DNA-binding protein